MSDDPRQLSPNFHRSEFACRGPACCGHASAIAAELVAALQALRSALGLPLVVTSGFRCPAHNATVPGAALNSAHTFGLAADVVPRPPSETAHAAALARRLGLFSSVARYESPPFLHLEVSFPPQNAPAAPKTAPSPAP